jgi:hypothetical protein
MPCELSSRPTFKPQLESLETRDLPSTAGIALFMDVQTIQQGVQAMQAQANAASNTFVQFGKDDHALIVNGVSGTTLQPLYTDFVKLGGEIQAVRFLNSQVQAELQGFQQAVFAVASDGDSSDQTLALFAYLQVNGGLGSLFPGGSGSGSLASQAQSALNQVNKIASATQTPSGDTLFMTIDQRLNS